MCMIEYIFDEIIKERAKDKAKRKVSNIALTDSKVYYRDSRYPSQDEWGNSWLIPNDDIKDELLLFATKALLDKS